MKYQKWIFGPAVVAFALSTGAAQAQDAKPAKPAKAAKKERPKRDPNAAAIAKDTKIAEELNGKALTDDQKTQLAQAVADRQAAIALANDAFKTNRARILGTTVEALDAKEKEMKVKAAEERKKAMEAKKAAG
jgi:hypothetical protein